MRYLKSVRALGILAGLSAIAPDHAAAEIPQPGWSSGGYSLPRDCDLFLKNRAEVEEALVNAVRLNVFSYNVAFCRQQALIETHAEPPSRDYITQTPWTSLTLDDWPPILCDFETGNTDRQACLATTKRYPGMTLAQVLIFRRLFDLWPVSERTTRTQISVAKGLPVNNSCRMHRNSEIYSGEAVFMKRLEIERAEAVCRSSEIRYEATNFAFAPSDIRYGDLNSDDYADALIILSKNLTESRRVSTVVAITRTGPERPLRLLNIPSLAD